MEDFNNPFSQFAKGSLNQASVREAMLHLQRHSGFNINVIFYLLWLAVERYGRLTKRNLKSLQMRIYPWHQRVIAELKYTCALVDDNSSDTAVKIKEMLQAEIAKAYLIEQQMLYDSKIKTKILKRTEKQQLADACTSIKHYCIVKNDLLVKADKEALIALLSHVFDTASKADIEKSVMTIFDRLQVSSNPVRQLMWEAF